MFPFFYLRLHIRCLIRSYRGSGRSFLGQDRAVLRDCVFFKHPGLLVLSHFQVELFLLINSVVLLELLGLLTIELGIFLFVLAHFFDAGVQVREIWHLSWPGEVCLGVVILFQMDFLIRRELLGALLLFSQLPVLFIGELGFHLTVNNLYLNSMFSAVNNMLNSVSILLISTLILIIIMMLQK